MHATADDYDTDPERLRTYTVITMPDDSFQIVDDDQVDEHLESINAHLEGQAKSATIHSVRGLTREQAEECCETSQR